YYFEEDWFLAESWDSNASQYRNPPDEDDDDVLDTFGQNASDDVVQSGAGTAALAAQVEQQQQQQRADDLPGWIELTLRFATDEEKGSERTYSQTILMYNKHSVETYLPEEDDELLQGARAGSRRDRNRGPDTQGSQTDGPAGGSRE